MPFEARSAFQRQAIPTVVTRKITYEASRYQPLLDPIRSIVAPRLICHIRKARTPALTSTCRAMRTGRLILTASGREAGVDTAQCVQRVRDVLVRVRRRKR